MRNDPAWSICAGQDPVVRRQTMQQARGRHDMATAAMSLTYRSDAAFSDDGRINLTDTSAQTPISTSQTTSGTQG
ncbi:MAG TPA: hypothetical protein VGH96_05735 [Streptosporangiaceae bacterium]